MNKGSVALGPAVVVLHLVAAASTVAVFQQSTAGFEQATTAPAPPRNLRIVTGIQRNLAPEINIGPDLRIALPAIASLNATVRDDGLPIGSVIVNVWSKVSGPGVVTFGDIYATSTSAAFSSPGSYVLALTATDGALSRTKSVTVIVDPIDQPAAPTIGINVSEAEYSWGSFAGTVDLAYLKSNGISLIRVPVAWERLQPSIGGPLNATYVGALKAFIQASGAQGMHVIVDVHNYGRYNRNWAQDAAANFGFVAVGKGDVIGTAAVPVAAFADLWVKVAGALTGTPGLAYYDIMNEPYNMGGAEVWPAAAQAAVNAIRTVDMNTPILVEGTQWARARYWPSDNGTLNVSDPAGRVYYEAHLYFDRDGSGRYLEGYTESGAYPTVGVDRVKPFLDWLKQRGAKGFVGEFGIPNNDSRWLTVLDNFLTAIRAAGVSGAYWNYTFHSPTDPAWWPADDPMSIRLDNGQANPQMNILRKHSGSP